MWMTFRPRGSVTAWLAATSYSRGLKDDRAVEIRDCSDRPGDGSRGEVEGGDKVESVFFFLSSHLDYDTVT